MPKRRKRFTGATPHKFGPFATSYPDRTYMLYKTTSGNTSTMALDIIIGERFRIPLVSEYERLIACGDCKGLNGGCAAYAPRFKKLAKKKMYAVVLALHYDMAWAIKFATPNDPKGREKTRPYIQQRYANRLTENLMNRIRKAVLAEHPDWLGLTLGNCPRCNPKSCAVLQGSRCKFPMERCFSMEATGVDIDRFHLDTYCEHLPWYDKASHALPTYMSRYIMFLAPKVGIGWKLRTGIQQIVNADARIVGIGTSPWSDHYLAPYYRSLMAIMPVTNQVQWVYADPPVERFHDLVVVKREGQHEGEGKEKVQVKGKPKGRTKRVIKIRPKAKGISRTTKAKGQRQKVKKKVTAKGTRSIRILRSNPRG